MIGHHLFSWTPVRFSVLAAHNHVVTSHSHLSLLLLVFLSPVPGDLFLLISSGSLVSCQLWVSHWRWSHFSVWDIRSTVLTAFTSAKVSHPFTHEHRHSHEFSNRKSFLRFLKIFKVFKSESSQGDFQLRFLFFLLGLFHILYSFFCLLMFQWMVDVLNDVL